MLGSSLILIKVQCLEAVDINTLYVLFKASPLSHARQRQADIMKELLILFVAVLVQS